jgi:hypothetical protein
VLSKSHAIGGQLVEVRRFDFFLAVATQFAIAKIIGQDENDIGARQIFGRFVGKDERGTERQ